MMKGFHPTLLYIQWMATKNILEKLKNMKGAFSIYDDDNKNAIIYEKKEGKLGEKYFCLFCQH